MNATRTVRGFVAGFLAVLIFHQIALLVLHLAGVVPATPWNLTPVPPLGALDPNTGHCKSRSDKCLLISRGYT